MLFRSKPKAKLPVVRITRAQKARFLELIAEGNTRQAAAAAVKVTGTKLRALCNPLAVNYDAAFATAYQAAVDAGNGPIVEALHEAALVAALDPSHLSFNRANHNQLLYRDPVYRAAHQRTLAAGAKVGADGTVEILLAFQDTRSEERRVGKECRL